ncbi:hypothetical protein [Gemella morbillorum]|uniref:hypothetical protein n=1 Tax=Gemella morbillorum TaxID=29391 RepID=UPI00248E01F1|nr:hypothetical protein [Gemella morbillorum]
MQDTRRNREDQGLSIESIYMMAALDDVMKDDKDRVDVKKAAKITIDDIWGGTFDCKDDNNDKSQENTPEKKIIESYSQLDKEIKDFKLDEEDAEEEEENEYTGSKHYSSGYFEYSNHLKDDYEDYDCLNNEIDLMDEEALIELFIGKLKTGETVKSRYLKYKKATNARGLDPVPFSEFAWYFD